MIIFGRIPVGLGLDRGDDAAADFLILPCDRRLRRRPLLFVLGKDGRAILGADVIALAVELGCVVDREKDVEQLGIADIVIVECDPDRLRMAGFAAADLLVGRVDRLPAGVAAFDRFDADDVQELRLGSPEAPARQNRDFIGHVMSPLGRRR